MAGLRRSDLDQLLEPREGPCVSLFIPTERVGRDVKQNPLRFKHALDAAEEQLVAAGMRTPDARELLAPGRELLPDSRFWNQQAAGLAVYLASGERHVLHLPVPVAEFAGTGERFLIRPLLPSFWPDQQFHVLALSQQEVRLLRGRRFGAERVDLPDVPHGIEDVTRFVVGEKTRQLHSGERRGASVVAMPHGHGGGKDDHDERVVEYVRAVAAGVGRVLRAGERSDGQPLVLAGVEYLRGLYREMHGGGGAAHATVLEQGIEGNPDRLGDDELHARAWPLVAPMAEVQVTSAVEGYAEAYGRGEARRDIEGVLVGALQARVGTLLLAADTAQWGRFDEDKGRARLHDAWRPRDDDLLDRAAAMTVATGGVVFTLPRERMPDGKPAVALFRY